MSADLLREAAKVMRERAEALGVEGSWRVQYIDPTVVPSDDADRWFIMEAPPYRGPYAICEWEPSADYFASWHPAAALAVADWLDRVLANPDVWGYVVGGREFRSAVAVARAYLGRDDA